MSEFALESFVGEFDGAIDFYWAEGNSPIVLANNLEFMAREFSDMTVPLALTRDKLIATVRENFEQEHDPEGVEWRPWAASYEERALSENIGILRKTEDLFHAATDPTAYPIIGNDLWVNTGGFPEYWAAHNYGSGRVPQRQFLGFSEQETFEVVDIFDRWFGGKIDATFGRFSMTPVGRVPKGQPGAGRFTSLRNP